MTTRSEEGRTDEKKGEKKGWSETERGKQMVGNIAC